MTARWTQSGWILAAAIGVLLAAGCGSSAGTDLVTAPAAAPSQGPSVTVEATPKPVGSPLAPPPFATSGAWTRTSASPLSARSYASAVWTGREILVYGGGDIGCAGPGGCRPGAFRERTGGALYDPAQDTWRLITPPPVHVDGMAAVVDGTVYFLSSPVSHNTKGDWGNELWSYSVREDRWRHLADPVKPTGPWPLQGIVATPAGLFTWTEYKLGGQRTWDQLYDIASNTWSPAPRNPRAVNEDRRVTSTPDGRIVSIGIPAVFDKHWRDQGLRPFMRASVLDPGAKAWRMIPAGDLLLDTDGGQVWGPAEGLVVKPDAGSLSDRRPDGSRKHPTGGMLDPVSGTWIPLPPQPKPAPGTIPFEAAVGWGGDFAISHGWALDVPHRRWYEVPQPIPGLDGMTGTSVVWTGHSLFAWGGDLTSETLFAPERLRGWIWTPGPDVSRTSGPSDP